MAFEVAAWLTPSKNENAEIRLNTAFKAVRICLALAIAGRMEQNVLRPANICLANILFAVYSQIQIVIFDKNNTKQTSSAAVAFCDFCYY